jgi:hypothetical protein
MNAAVKPGMPAHEPAMRGQLSARPGQPDQAAPAGKGGGAERGLIFMFIGIGTIVVIVIIVLVVLALRR